MTQDQQQTYDKAAQVIANAIGRMKKGEKVTSLGYELQKENLIALPPEIGQLTTLTELDLYNNH